MNAHAFTTAMFFIYSNYNLSILQCLAFAHPSLIGGEGLEMCRSLGSARNP